jgi:hypothetical protein
MRPILYPILCLALFTGACNKYDIKPEQAEGFIKFFSNNLTEEAYDVKPTADGGYVAIGTTTDENGMRDLYLVKTDACGNEESWSPAIIGGTHDDVGTSIQVEADGYVILGYSNEKDTNQYDMYLVKTDLLGKVIWERWSDNPYDERGISLKITTSGEYLAAGLRYNNLGFYGYLIIRFDTQGNIVKTGVINLENVLDVHIIETAENFMLCGTEQLGGKNQIRIVPVDKESHRAVGGKVFAETGSLSGHSILELGDGNLLLCGTNQNIQSGRNEIYLNKIGPDFEAVPGWESSMHFSDNIAGLSGNAVRAVGTDGYAIIGTRTVTGNDDIILLRTDGNGYEISRKTFGDAGFQRGVSLEVTGDGGGLILVGNNGSEDKSMMALVRTDADGNL